MSNIDELQARLDELRSKLAELEDIDDEAQATGQRLRNDWREASIAADLDNDADAARVAEELQARLQSAQLDDERRRHNIAAVKTRIREVEGQIRQAEEAVPMEFERKRPGIPVPLMTRLAKSLPGRLGEDAGWESITQDRAAYEIRRAFPGNEAAVMRSLRAGSEVRTWDYILRAKVVDDNSQS